MKKLVTLFLSVMMLATCLFGLGVEAAVNIAPSFTELDENGLPVGWTTAGSNTTVAGATVVTEMSDGALVVKGVASDGETLAKVQPVIAFDLNHRQLMVPGETYKVSFSYHIAGGSHHAHMVSSTSRETIPAEDAVDADGVPVHIVNGAYETKNKWTSVEFTFTASRHTPYHWFYFTGNRNGTRIMIKDVKVEGVRRPNSEPVVGSEIIANGGFTGGSSEGWTLSAPGVLQTDADSNTYAALPNVGDYAEITFPVGDSKVYEVQADVKSSLDGSLKTAIRTAPATAGNQASGAPFFDRVLDYNYTFVSSGSAWKKIKFNVYPSDTYSNEITIRFENVLEDTELAFDNFSVKPTKELISNGDFEGLAFYSKSAAKSANDEDVTDGIPGWNVAYNNGVGSVSFGASDGENSAGATVAITAACNGDTEPYLTQKVRMESGKTYKVTYSIKATNTNCPKAGWQTNSNGGVANQNDIYWHDLKTTAWETVTKYITMPSVNTDGEAWITKDTAWQFRWGTRNKVGSYCVDNVSIQEVANGVNYYNENGEKYTSLADAKGKTVYSCFASAALPEDTEISLISALYDVSSGTPMLVDATVRTGKNSMNAPIYGTIDIPDYKGTYKLSVFCLDSITGLKALEAKYNFE